MDQESIFEGYETSFLNLNDPFSFHCNMDS